MKLGGQEEKRPQEESRSEEKEVKGALGHLKQWWEKQEPSTQRKLALWGLVGLFVIFLLVGYSAWKKPKPEQPPPAQEGRKRVLKLEATDFERSLYAKTTQEVEGLKVELKQLHEEVQKLSERILAPSAVPQTKQPKASAAEQPSQQPEGIPPEPQALQPTFTCAEGSAGGVCGYPPPPSGETLRQVQMQTRTRSVPYQIIGSVALVKGKVSEEKKGEEEKKRARMRVYLPPSFMEATLLSGITAPATSEGQKNPIPVLLRIHNLAVLPNQVKANLKGCFLIGEATGNLADERAHVRLVTLSCVAKNGEAVIDQRVKGFVVDEDGKVGLRGHVVSRMGATIARAALAGLFGGIGEGIAWNTYTLYTSSEGATILSQTDFENMARAGIGKGIQQAAQELQKFYLELARQTLPVVEVGATKKVTVVISEGVELEIKNQKIFSGKQVAATVGTNESES